MKYGIINNIINSLILYYGKSPVVKSKEISTFIESVINLCNIDDVYSDKMYIKSGNIIIVPLNKRDYSVELIHVDGILQIILFIPAVEIFSDEQDISISYEAKAICAIIKKVMEYIDATKSPIEDIVDDWFCYLMVYKYISTFFLEKHVEETFNQIIKEEKLNIEVGHIQELAEQCEMYKDNDKLVNSFESKNVIIYLNKIL